MTFNTSRLTGKAARGVMFALLAGLLFCVCDSAFGRSAMPFPPPGNSAWVYDTLYSHGKARGRAPGSFAGALNAYNRQATPGHEITRVYPYGGDLEMYCNHDASSCTPDDLIVVFGGSAGGSQSVAAYSQQLKATGGRKVQITPVLDGSIKGAYQGSLKGFNELSPKLARIFADKVARQMCADPRVDGVQFDLEPFDVSSRNGQYYFYRRIADDFSGRVDGKPGNDPFHCVDQAHPRGRYFSVFGSVHSLKPGTASARHVQEIMTAHHNGYFIVALYDLLSDPPGQRTPVHHYERLAQRQARMAHESATRLGVPYQLAIPAAASTHEFAACHGEHCKGGQAQFHESAQLSYVKAAMRAVKASGAVGDSLYLGTAVWCWNRDIVHGGARFMPSEPKGGVISYLGKHL